MDDILYIVRINNP